MRTSPAGANDAEQWRRLRPSAARRPLISATASATWNERNFKNPHNKQWNSNYQPEKTIFPTLWHLDQRAVQLFIATLALLTHQKEEEGGDVAEDKIKIIREKKAEGLIRRTGTKTRCGTNLNNVTIRAYLHPIYMQRDNQTPPTLCSTSWWMSEVGGLPPSASSLGRRSCFTVEDVPVQKCKSESSMAIKRS